MDQVIRHAFRQMDCRIIKAHFVGSFFINNQLFISSHAVQALLFDCDGVLVDTEKDGHRVAFNEAFKQLGGTAIVETPTQSLLMFMPADAHKPVEDIKTSSGQQIYNSMVHNPCQLRAHQGGKYDAVQESLTSGVWRSMGSCLRLGAARSA